MKRVFSFVVAAVAALTMVSCAQNCDKTIANLKAAIDGESGASAKYAAFAIKATEEGNYNVACLFKAASEAEAMHVKNHQVVLAKLGVTDYVANVDQFSVDSTAANLQTAILGETYESEVMYPDFIAVAQEEKCNDALVTFNYALLSEQIHALLYSSAATGNATNVYYLCVKCGNILADKAGEESCIICQSPSSEFKIFTAEVPAETVAANVK